MKLTSICATAAVFDLRYIHSIPGILNRNYQARKKFKLAP
jgi:hypothetical protein